MTMNSSVHTKEQILYWFEQADYQDCRINAYPAFLSKQKTPGNAVYSSQPVLGYIDAPARGLLNNYEHNPKQ